MIRPIHDLSYRTTAVGCSMPYSTVSASSTDSRHCTAAITLDPHALHFSDDGGIDDQTTEGCDGSHVQPGEAMHGLHEDAREGQVPARGWPNRERHEGMHRRVAQLAQLLVLEPIQEAEVSVRCPWSDQRPGAIRRAETIRVGLGIPPRTLAIPPEQGADAAPQPQKCLDYRGRRLAPRDHHGPHVLDGTAGAPTRERNCPGVLQWDVMQQCMHAKGPGAKFTWIDSYRHARPFCGPRVYRSSRACTAVRSENSTPSRWHLIRPGQSTS